MTGSERPRVSACPACGREYGGEPPAYCVACGSALRNPPAARGTAPADGVPAPAPPAPRRRRRTAVAVTAVILAALLVLGGGAFALFHFLGGGEEGPRALPVTAAGLRESIGECEKYLNQKGAALAKGRSDGATIYSVKARLDTEEGAVTGEQTLLFTNRTPDTLGEVVFRVYANGAEVRGELPEATVSAARVDGEEARSALSGSLLTITLPRQLAPGAEVVVSFSFKEYVPELPGALGGLEGMLAGTTEGGYGIFGRDANTYNLGYFMPLVAMYADGAWESREVPRFGDIADFDCAYFNVSLDVPQEFRVAATGLQNGSGSSGGRRELTFAAGPVRDFSVQASRVYQSSSKRVGATEVTSYYLEGSGDSGRKVLDFTAQALEQYGKRFGPYPYRRLNVCEAPLAGGAAGMEFTGQILIAQMLYRLTAGADTLVPESLRDLGGGETGELLDSLTGGLLGDTLEFVVAHEVCHQWWGMVVGSDAIAHPWQDESLTNYCSVLHFRWAHGEEAAAKQLEMQITLPYQAGSMMGGGDAVVDSPLYAFANQEQYTAAVYSKGALFFRALEEQMGAAAFEEALRSYYRDYAFRVATPKDLMRAFEGAGDRDAVTALHQRWIKEKHAGEDIDASLPGANLLEDLMNNIAPELDLDQLEDVLKDFWNELSPEGGPAPELPFPSDSPSIPI